MGALDGRVAIITGAGRGIGREHALLFASEGASVVVNDLGGGVAGDGEDPGPAQRVADEIVAAGGTAVASNEDVASWEGAERLIGRAIAAFDDLHVLVNNAGILRDRMLVSMTEEEWDSVIHVHLKGHFCPTRHAAAYWRERHRDGHPVRACVVNTSSVSGLFGNVGQSNYGAAKAGIAAFTVITDQELSRYGVRVNAISPAARTRMTESTPGLADIVAPPADPGAFDVFDPANVSPLVAALAVESCTVHGQVIDIRGGVVARLRGWGRADTAERPERWAVDDLAKELENLAPASDGAAAST
jgi:NAD(P)-dependent dehydrogenase (short-subunit alcohol dehydrogenase family)